VPARPHARSRDLATAAVQFCTAHRLVMIRFLLLTRDRWAWHRQCDAGALPVRGVLGRVSSQARPATSSPPNPLCPHGHFRATVVILDPQERPADRSYQRQADHSKPIGRPLG
jgi:hypothetical protein